MTLSAPHEAEALPEALEGPTARPVTREFTVATFVVHEGRILLHRHKNLALWLPPGGHIEPNELPDEAAVREVEEETGVLCWLMGEKALPIAYPYQLTVPAGIQLEDIEPGHQHIDLVYFARPVPGREHIDPVCAARDLVGWYHPDELEPLGVNKEVQSWCAKALAAVS